VPEVRFFSLFSTAQRPCLLILFPSLPSLLFLPFLFFLFAEKLAREMSGFWDGRSVRTTDKNQNKIDLSNTDMDELITEWADCEISFNLSDGRITGNGYSIWLKESIPFVLYGACDKKMGRIHLVKSHFGKYSTTTHYNLTLTASGLCGLFFFFLS
jgi:hypothetical protein